MPNATALVGAKLTLDNGKVVTLHEGDIVQNLTYKVTTVSTNTITGAVRVIHAATTKATDPNTCPPSSYISKLLNITSLVIDTSLVYNASLVKVDVSKIVDIESVAEDGGAIVVGPGSQYKDLNSVIEDAPEGSVISLKAGEYTDAVTVTKSVTIVADGEAVLSAPFTVKVADTTDPVTVAVEGVTFTGSAQVKVDSSVDEFALRGCIFDGITYTAKTMPIAITTNATKPMLLEITDCTFGDLGSYSYNLIDVYAPLMAGSTISNNTFRAASCVHNQISLYGLDTDGVIEISNNYVEDSKNLVRIGFKGAPVGTVEILENTMLKTDAGEWAGLCCVQPYGSATTTMAGLKIVLNGNVNKTTEDQLIYMYAGGSDTKFTDDNKPTIEIDGKDVTASVAVYG